MFAYWHWPPFPLDILYVSIISYQIKKTKNLKRAVYLIRWCASGHEDWHPHTTWSLFYASPTGFYTGSKLEVLRPQLGRSSLDTTENGFLVNTLCETKKNSRQPLGLGEKIKKYSNIEKQKLAYILPFWYSTVKDPSRVLPTCLSQRKKELKSTNTYSTVCYCDDGEKEREYVPVLYHLYFKRVISN